MDDELCGTMWSTYTVLKNGDKIDGRRHACRFSKGHKGSICACVCGKYHKNLDKVEEQVDALV